MTLKLTPETRDAVIARLNPRASYQIAYAKGTYYASGSDLKGAARKSISYYRGRLHVESIARQEAALRGNRLEIQTADHGLKLIVEVKA